MFVNIDMHLLVTSSWRFILMHGHEIFKQVLEISSPDWCVFERQIFCSVSFCPLQDYRMCPFVCGCGGGGGVVMCVCVCWQFCESLYVYLYLLYFVFFLLCIFILIHSVCLSVCLHRCTDCCHRVTTHLQLVITVINNWVKTDKDVPTVCQRSI
jgi:hypothetical protein